MILRRERKKVKEKEKGDNIWKRKYLVHGGKEEKKKEKEENIW